MRGKEGWEFYHTWRRTQVFKLIYRDSLRLHLCVCVCVREKGREERDGDLRTGETVLIGNIP